MGDRRPFSLFILATVMLLFFSLPVFIIWYLNFFGFSPLLRVLLLLLGTVFSLVLLLLILGIVVTLVAFYGNKPLGSLIFFTKIVISYFFPLIIKLGTCLGFNRAPLQATFIQLTNRIQQLDRPLEPEKLLVLIPHCLQLTTCSHKVTHRIDNCKRCGSCQVDELLELRDKYGFHLRIVSGGTQARRVVNELRPEGVVAVACERDLSSGIMDTYPLPVLGVVNIRPQGPCVNTRVIIQRLEESIISFLRRKET